MVALPKVRRKEVDRLGLKFGRVARTRQRVGCGKQKAKELTPRSPVEMEFSESGKTEA